MGFLGVNPRRNARLDTLRKSIVSLRGIPVPLPPTLAELPGQAPREDVLQALQKRLKEPRADRDRLYREALTKLEAQRPEIYGTAQQPMMLEFEEGLYTAFIPDLLTSEDARSFLSHWKLRGLVPAVLEASKTGSAWSYRFVEGCKYS